MLDQFEVEWEVAWKLTEYQQQALHDFLIWLEKNYPKVKGQPENPLYEVWRKNCIALHKLRIYLNIERQKWKNTNARS